MTSTARTFGCAAVLLSLAAGCGDDARPSTDAGAARDASALDATTDAATADAESTDAGSLDATSMDASFVDTGPPDAGTRDAFVPDAGPLTALDPAKLARAAVVFGSCIPDDGPSGFVDWLLGRRLGDDVTDLPIDAAAWIDCLAGATSGCAAVAACTGLTFDFGGPCTPACEGTTAVSCDDAWRFRLDCSAFGMICAAGSCVRETAPTCDDETFVPRCDGPVPVECEDGFERAGARPCTDFGLTCEEGECVGTGAPCDADDASGVACTSASTLRYCIGGRTAEVTCDDIATGSTCQTLSPGDPPSEYFCGVDDACSPAEAGREGTCEGDKLVFCAAGKREEIDCTTLGFTGCDGEAGLCTRTP